MRLQAAAHAFDKMPCLDAYSGQWVFNGQLIAYDETKRDSETAERRVISVAPGTALPARRVVEAAGTRFILGHRNPDVFRGSVIREGYVAHEATELSQVRTLEQACLNSAGVTAWAGRAWVKNNAYSEQSSHLAPQHHVFFASSETILNDLLLTFEGHLLVVRAWNYGAGGTLVASCEELPEPTIETVSFTGGTWDPVTEAMSGAPANVRVVRVRWQSLFAYRSNLAPKFGPEDIQVAVAKSAFTVTAGTRMTASDGSWVIASVLDEGAVWLCRATRHV